MLSPTDAVGMEVKWRKTSPLKWETRFPTSPIPVTYNGQ